jgi:DUF1680 family protein
MATGFTIIAVFFLLLPAMALSSDGKAPSSPSKLRTFKTGEIKLRPGRLKNAFVKNSEYLKSLDSDMLLYAYRFFAYRKYPGRPCGGWESPLDPNKGTFLGHWLSAAAQSYAQSGDKELLKKAQDIVADLRLSQTAHGNGWVQASGPERLYVLEGKHGGDPDFSVITAPYYPIHKLLAGLVDMHNLADSEEALTVARGLADFLKEETATLSDEKLQKILEREHGGIEEVFYNLAEATGDRSYSKLGKRFEHRAFTGPLKKHEDKLADLHANTQLPKLIGEARRWELLGEKDARDLVEFAWSTVASTRTYATGGSSSKEYWRNPNALGETLCAETQESCTTYNWIKLTRHLLEWTGDAKYGDMIELALINGIMPAQNPSTGMFVYFLPLTTDGATKKWGSATEDFWCCYGTMVESFSTLADNAYFATEGGLAVNLYVPSETTWEGVKLTQETSFPESDTSKITLKLDKEKAFDLMLRVPGWVSASDARVTVNGVAIDVAVKPGTFLKLQRTWRGGDAVEATWPKRLRLQACGDDPSLVAVLFGPVVLGALTDKPVALPSNALDGGLKRLGDTLEFEASGVRFKPLCDIVDEAYAAYFRRG